MGALVGFLGTALQMPWGIALTLAAMYLLYTTVQQARSPAGRRVGPAGALDRAALAPCRGAAWQRMQRVGVLSTAA